MKLCSHCGAPIKAGEIKCSYCRTDYNKAVLIDATSPIFDVKLKDETLKMYISNIENCSLIDSGRDANGRFSAKVVRRNFRKITLVEI